MILLADIADAIQVITGQAGLIDVHASYVDYDPATPNIATPGRKNTAISTPNTYSVILPPTAGIARNMKTLHIRNKDIAATVTVTVRHTDGTTPVELHKLDMAPGSTLQYTDGLGFMQL